MVSATSISSFAPSIGERTRSAKKRLLVEVASPRKLQKEGASVKEVVSLSLEELVRILQKVKQLRGVNYQTSIDRLKNHQIKVEKKSVPLFTDFIDPKSSNVEYSQLWISVNDVWLDMRLHKAPYNSNLLDEKVVYPNAEKGSLYDYLSIIEDSAIPLLNLRCGIKGDLIWIKKGASISGDAIKSLCFNLLENYPFTSHIYLFDDAKINDIRLGTLLPIADPLAKTWYGRNSCSPVTCENWKIIRKKDFLTQDARSYNIAVKRLRETSLTSLAEFSSPKKKLLIDLFISKYFKEEAPAALTLHDMALKLYMLSKSERSSIGESAACQDLTKFYKIFTSPQANGNALSEEKAGFIEALTIVNNTILWERNF